MHPRHDRLSPRRSPQPQRLLPDLSLILLYFLQLLILLLFPTLFVFEVSRRPFAFPAPVYEFLRMFLERGDGVEGEFIIGGYLDCGARDDHGSQGFIGAEKIFGEVTRDGYEVAFEVVGIAYEEGGGDNVGKSFRGEVASDRRLCVSTRSPWRCKNKSG